MARAPLLLSESLLFPYRDGVSFEQTVWMDEGRNAAFTGTLDRPPTSSWEILNPLYYEQRRAPSVPLLPNIHPLVDKLYKPYDIGQIGQLDLHILTELYGGDQADSDLTPAWDGGLYWAGQSLSAKTAAEQAGTNSIAIFYLSQWKNAASAQAFARLYAWGLARKYSSVQLDQSGPVPAPSGPTNESAASISQEQVYSTSEGPAVITTRGKLVFVAESFPLDLARQLTALLLDAQGTGEMKMAQNMGAPGLDSETGESMNHNNSRAPSCCHPERAQWGPRRADFARWGGERVEGPVVGTSGAKLLEGHETNSQAAMQPLTASLIRFFSNCGVMKSAVEAAVQVGK
jgi:hypothetical protein